jgi:hypothetical protein
MATIIISDLQPLQEKTFLYDLNSEQKQQILGGIPFLSGIPFFGRSGTQLTTIYDGINAVETAYRGPFSFYDNKILTVDFARTAIYLVV